MLHLFAGLDESVESAECEGLVVVQLFNRHIIDTTAMLLMVQRHLGLVLCFFSAVQLQFVSPDTFESKFDGSPDERRCNQEGASPRFM